MLSSIYPTTGPVDIRSKIYVSFADSLKKLVQLGVTVIAVFAVSFGPFVSHLPQLASRLFPVARGLTHSYWAGNVWALYSAGDLLLSKILPKFGFAVGASQAKLFLLLIFQ